MRACFQRNGPVPLRAEVVYDHLPTTLFDAKYPGWSNHIETGVFRVSAPGTHLRDIYQEDDLTPQMMNSNEIGGHSGSTCQTRAPPVSSAG